MTSKDLTKKLSYEEINGKIKEIALEYKNIDFRGKTEEKINNLRINYILNYDLYTIEERENLRNQFQTLNSLENSSNSILRVINGRLWEISDYCKKIK